MERISFKAEIDTQVLREAIELKTQLGYALESISYYYIPDHLKDSMEYGVTESNLVLDFNRALISEEKDEIANLINNLDDTHELVIRKKIKEVIIKDKFVFGNEFIQIFSANNEYREKSQAQILGMMQKYPDILMLCLSGSIESLYYVLSNMQEDEFISSQEIEEFKKRVEFFLYRMNSSE
jgi:hypothetical protein